MGLGSSGFIDPVAAATGPQGPAGPTTRAAIQTVLALGTGVLIAVSDVISAPNTGDVIASGSTTVVQKLTGVSNVVNMPAATSLTCGSNPAGIGTFRLSNLGSIYAKTTNATDCNLILLDGANLVCIADLTAAGTYTQCADGGIHRFVVNSVEIVRIGATFLSLGATTAASGTIRLPPGFTIKSLNNTNQTLQLLTADATNNAVTLSDNTINGVLTLKGGTSRQVNIDCSSYIYRFSAGLIQLFSTTDATAIQIDGNTGIIGWGATVGSCGLYVATGQVHNLAYNSVITHQFAAATVSLFSTTAANAIQAASSGTVTFGSALTTPALIIGQATSDNAVVNLQVQAQDASASSTINTSGAILRLQGGKAKTEGTTGLRGGTTLELSSTGVVLAQVGEVAVGRRFVAFNRTAVMTSSQLGANTGDLVVYFGDALTAPTVSASSGFIMYSSGGAPYFMLPSDVSIGFLGTAATASNGAGEAMKANVDGYITTKVNGTTVKIPFVAN